MWYLIAALAGAAVGYLIGYIVGDKAGYRRVWSDIKLPEIDGWKDKYRSGDID